MFTGIIAAIGSINRVEPLGNDDASGVRLQIDAGDLSLADVALGDSIAINGACMTVVDKEETRFSVEVSRESLNCTTGLDQTGWVNLEKAMTLQDRLGGHLVSGHVDGIGTVLRFEAVGESHELVILAPASLAKYLAHKGSVVVNGVSLTVNDLSDVKDNAENVEDGESGAAGEGCAISINLIPHTISATTLQRLEAGSKVNLEIDLIARYVERMLSTIQR